MDNYPPFSYPESGDSSPLSREIDFENPPPTWEEPSPPPPPPQQQPPPQPPQPATQKVKFMVSYGGKIQPRPHDNVLSYVGGETKILAVDRWTKFIHIRSRLAALVSSVSEDGFVFKYQLPGEDLDALITVTNDEDLDHMMHEFDRLSKASSPKPPRLRLFLFVDHQFLSQLSRSRSLQPQQRSSVGSEFSSLSEDRESGVAPQNSVVGSEPMQQQQQLPVQNNVDFLFGLDKVEPMQQQQQQTAMFPPTAKSEENFAGETLRNTPSPVNFPTNVQIPQGYWQPIEHQNQIQNQNQNHQLQQQMHQFHLQQQQQQQQPVYMMHAPPAQGNMYHAPPNQGYYQVQQMPVYGAPPPQVMTAESAGFAPVNQVYYTPAVAAQGGGVSPVYGGVTTTAAAVSEEMKVVQKVGTSSGGV